MKASIVPIMLLNCLLLLSVCSYPTLNEKNQEISWEAWLLVDDQNANRQQPSQAVPKRRITPKSVFIAPMFSPENLPPCAEGYSSDPMGRCVKIIKIDEDKHFDFLVSKLNERFGNLDYEGVFEATDEEPTRLDIPLDSEDYYDYSNDTPQFDNMAIIVTPTTREKEDVSKVVKRDQITTTMPTTIGEEDAISEDATTASGEDEVATTSSGEDEVVATTTVSANEDAETTTTSGDAATTISDVPTTTITDEEVTTTTEVATTTAVATTTTPKITTYHPLATTYHPYFDLDSLKTGSRTKNFVKFPEEEALPRNFVKFPDAGPRTRNLDSQTGNFLNEIVTPEPSERVLTRFYSHKERHKPVVLRFPRKHFSFDFDKFKNGEFYRSLPMDDLTYLFGYKSAQQSRNR